MSNLNFGTEFSDSISSMAYFDTKMKKLLIRGAILLSAFVLFIPVMILLPQDIAEILFIPGLVISMMISSVGVYFLAISSTWKYYIYGIRILQRTSHSDPTITEMYSVTKHKDAIIFILRSAPCVLYFVSFIHSELIPGTEIDVPRTFWKWNSTLHIEGLRVHDRRRRFSIPTPEGEVLSGEGILLALPIRGKSYILHVPEFSRDRLLAIVERLSLLATDGVSGI